MLKNQIVIGHQVTGNGDNTAVIGNTDVTDVYMGSPGINLLTEVDSLLPSITTILDDATDATLSGLSTQTNGSGSNAILTIVISGNTVTSVTITAAGSNYAIGDTLTVAKEDIPGTGNNGYASEDLVFTLLPSAFNAANIHCREITSYSLETSNDEITLRNHIIPDTTDTYDIGSAEKKIRDIYVSDDSLWIGDNHKVSISGGKMKFRKRKLNYVPAIILTAGGSEAGAIAYAQNNFNDNITSLSDLKLRHWVKYLRSFGGEYSNGKVKDLFRDNSDDYDEESNATFWKEGTDSKITTTENIDLNTNLNVSDISKLQIPGGSSGQVIQSNGDNTLSWTNSITSALISSSQLESHIYNNNATYSSNTTLVNTSDNSLTVSKTGLLMIFFNSVVQTDSSDNIRFGLKLTVYKEDNNGNDVALDASLQPKEVYSEGESSNYAPDLHSLSISKQVNVTKDDVIKYKIDLTIYQAGNVHFGTNGTNAISKYCEVQSVIFGISDDEFISKSQPVLGGDLNLSNNSIKNLSASVSTAIETSGSLSDKDASIIPLNSSGGPITYTINTSLMSSGKILIFKDIGGGASSNNITIEPEGGETIDGSSSHIISQDYGKLKIFCHDNNWYII